MFTMFGDISEIDLIEIFALTLFIPVIVLLLYEKVRSQFPIKVNCWFCNSYLYVAYNDRDCFTCTSCRQYNGFNADGSYNRPIPEQYDDMLNPQTERSNKNSQEKKQVPNRLCKICNNNQQLKVYQLANFIPLIEDNFDMEIEHFQKQLEKAYKLCQKCDNMVNKTIKQQTKRLIGKKMLYYRKKGLDSSISENAKKNFVLNLFKLISLPLILILAIFFVLNDFFGLKYLLQRFSTKHQLTYSMVATSFFSTGLIALIGSWYYIHNKLSKLNKNKIKTESLKPVSKEKGKLSKTTSSTNLQLNSTDISSDSIESDYEDFSETIKSRNKSPLLQKTIPIFGERAVLQSSLNQAKSPISFEELNRTKFNFNRSKHDLSQSFVSLDTSFRSARSLNEFNINTGQFSQIRKPSVFKPQELAINFSNLNLNSSILSTKPILSPSKINNPWSGLNTKFETLSRSSSQSSGIFSNNENYNSLPNSRSTSINGDNDNSSILAETTFVCNKNTPSLQLSKKNNFSFINKNNYFSDTRSIKSAFSQPRSNLNHYADMHPFNTSFNISNFD